MFKPAPACQQSSSNNAARSWLSDAGSTNLGTGGCQKRGERKPGPSACPRAETKHAQPEESLGKHLWKTPVPVWASVPVSVPTPTPTSVCFSQHYHDFEDINFVSFEDVTSIISFIIRLNTLLNQILNSHSFRIPKYENMQDCAKNLL